MRISKSEDGWLTFGGDDVSGSGQRSWRRGKGLGSGRHGMAWNGGRAADGRPRIDKHEDGAQQSILAIRHCAGERWRGSDAPRLCCWWSIDWRKPQWTLGDEETAGHWLFPGPSSGQPGLHHLHPNYHLVRRTREAYIKDIMLLDYRKAS